MSVTTTWIKEEYPNEPVLWSSYTFPWQLPTPWLYPASNGAPTVWVKEY